MGTLTLSSVEKLKIKLRAESAFEVCVDIVSRAIQKFA